jgi:CheY-like chemotaxis protein
VNPLILIADGRDARRRQLAEAFRARGLEIEVVADGASALEQALSLRPALVVAASDLSLVEAPKLAEILRANPRTRSVRFVFVGEDGHVLDTHDSSDAFLPQEVLLEDVVATAESELAIRDRLSELNNAVEEQDRPSGYFPDVPLLEVMHCLNLWKRSGRLDLRREGHKGGQGRGSVWLHDGEVVDAELGDAQGRKALYRLMEWEHGQFALDPSGLHVKRTPIAPLGPLLKEGTRQLSQGRVLGAQLPAHDSPIRLRVRASDLPNILHPLTQEVLSLLELHATVAEVVDHCSYPDYQVLRTLSTLADRAIIELGPQALRGHDDTQLFDDHQIRRLNEWTLCEPIHSPRAPLKLLVAASRPEALSDFAGLLRRVPGATLASGFESGEADSRCFSRLALVECDAGVAIELINVPIAEELAPLWPTAGSGALGTLFLLSGSVGQAASNVQPMNDALRRLPRSRIFNLYLFHKDEPISASELGENISLIDEASLFMLPLEGGKPPLALIRSVFSRVVP